MSAPSIRARDGVGTGHRIVPNKSPKIRPPAPRVALRDARTDDVVAPAPSAQRKAPSAPDGLLPARDRLFGRGIEYYYGAARRDPDRG